MYLQTGFALRKFFSRYPLFGPKPVHCSIPPSGWAPFKSPLGLRCIFSPLAWQDGFFELSTLFGRGKGGGGNGHILKTKRGEFIFTSWRFYIHASCIVSNQQPVPPPSFFSSIPTHSNHPLISLRLMTIFSYPPLVPENIHPTT